MCSLCSCSSANTEKPFFFFFSQCFYDWVFGAWICRAWGEQPPQDNAGKWVLGIKTSLYSYPKPDVHQLSPLPTTAIAGQWVQPPPSVCVWKWGPDPKRALGRGCSITFSVPLRQEAPTDPLPGSSPRTPSLKGCGMFIIVLVIRAVVMNCSLPLVIRRERIKYGYIGLSSLPVT